MYIFHKAENRRRMHNEELHKLYDSSNIKRTKSGRMRWTGHKTRMEEMKNTKFLSEKVKGRNHL
jgi:hypothetical protein